MDKIIHGKVKKGKFTPYDPTAFRLSFAKLEGKEVEVVVRKKKKRRTDEQRKYYFGVIVALIAEEMGDRDINAVHEALKVKFLYDLSGEFPEVKSTKDLTTVEEEEYHSEIREWASSFLSMYIPLPNEVAF